MASHAGGPDQRPGDIADERHGTADHVDDRAPDDHAHGSPPLGPVDVAAWGALAVGLAMGLAVAVCLGLSAGYLG